MNVRWAYICLSCFKDAQLYLSGLPPFQPFHMNVPQSFPCFPLAWQQVLPELSPPLFSTSAYQLSNPSVRIITRQKPGSTSCAEDISWSRLFLWQLMLLHLTLGTVYFLMIQTCGWKMSNELEFVFWIKLKNKSFAISNCWTEMLQFFSTKQGENKFEANMEVRRWSFFYHALERNYSQIFKPHLWHCCMFTFSEYLSLQLVMRSVGFLHFSRGLSCAAAYVVWGLFMVKDGEHKTSLFKKKIPPYSIPGRNWPTTSAFACIWRWIMLFIWRKATHMSRPRH